MAKRIKSLNANRWYNGGAFKYLFTAEEGDNFLIRGDDGLELVFKNFDAREQAMKELIEDAGGVYETPVPDAPVVVEEVKPVETKRPARKYGIIYPEDSKVEEPLEKEVEPTVIIPDDMETVETLTQTKKKAGKK